MLLRLGLVVCVTLGAASAQAQGIVVADIDRDYRPGSPANLGWSFAWNPTGVAIGDSANYQSLIFDRNGWETGIEPPDEGDPDADPPIPPEDPTDDFLNQIGTDLNSRNNTIRIGQRGDVNDPRGSIQFVTSGRAANNTVAGAANSTDMLDHYVILGYTLRPGDVDPNGGLVQVSTGGSSGGETRNFNIRAELKFFLNDNLIDTKVRETFTTEDTQLDFDVDIADANVGDTVYIAYLSDNGLGRNPRRWFPDIMIASATATEFSGDFDQNRDINAADFVLFRDSVGSVDPLPNDDGLDGLDLYGLWASEFTTEQPAGGAVQAAATPVPEPAGWLLVSGLAGLVALRRTK